MASSSPSSGSSTSEGSDSGTGDPRRRWMSSLLTALIDNAPPWLGLSRSASYGSCSTAPVEASGPGWDVLEGLRARQETLRGRLLDARTAANSLARVEDAIAHELEEVNEILAQEIRAAPRGTRRR